MDTFAWWLSELERALGDLGEDPCWASILRRLRRYRFNICSTFLPFNHPDFVLAVVPPTDLLRWQQVYPSTVEIANEVFDLLKKLQSAPANPLLAALENVVFNSSDVAVLIKESRFIPECEELLRERRLVCRVLSTAELRGAQVCDHLVVIGAARWFPEYVFNSPRALRMSVICFDGIANSWRWTPTLIGSRTSQLMSNRELEMPRKQPSSVGARIQPDDVYPVVNLEALARTLSVEPAQGIRTLEAKLVLLESGFAALLNAARGAKFFTIDVEESGSGRVNQTRVEDIAPGLFIVLRTRGGGDYITDMANIILQNDAERLRSRQREWKEELLNVVQDVGMDTALTLLTQEGALRASKNNLDRWIDEASIRPRAEEDFLAILRVIGRPRELRGLLRDMDVIKSAHVQAGQSIRDQLLRQAEAADLRQLVHLGTKEFRLASDQASLTAFRIIDIMPRAIHAVPSHLLQPFRWEEERQWHE